MKSAWVMRAMIFGQRRLADARRAPEDERAGVIALDLYPQRFAGREDVLLPDEFVERARTHAVGQRPRLVHGIVVRDLLEEVHKVIPQRNGGTEKLRSKNSLTDLGFAQTQIHKHLKKILNLCVSASLW